MQSEPRSARTPVWALPLSLAATHGIDVSFSSSGYLDVSVHRVPLHTLWIGVWMTEGCSAGFPHSDISGSMDICSSPKLFAAYHVFHRLLVPRHPPCALLRLTICTYSVICSGRVVFLSWLSCNLSVTLLLVISIRLSSEPILGCLVINLKFRIRHSRTSPLVRDILRISLLAVIYSLLYASVQRLYLPSSEYSLHDLSDIFYLYAVFKVRYLIW